MKLCYRREISRHSVSCDGLCTSGILQFLAHWLSSCTKKNKNSFETVSELQTSCTVDLSNSEGLCVYKYLHIYTCNKHGETWEYYWSHISSHLICTCSKFTFCPRTSLKMFLTSSSHSFTKLFIYLCWSDNRQLPPLIL